MPPEQSARGVPPLTVTRFGQVEGHDVDLYRLTNARGAEVKITTYGAIVTSLSVPDRAGKMADVVLGFDRLEGYLKESPYFGATVGRVANRIREARFQLDEQDYQVAANDGRHHLHGGLKGWDKVLWAAEPVASDDGAALKLTYLSPDGEEGYPGAIAATVIYTLTNDNELRVAMSAITDRSTVVNMVHHT
jgi:aldose 1-epimerase